MAKAFLQTELPSMWHELPDAMRSKFAEKHIPYPRLTKDHVEHKDRSPLPPKTHNPHKILLALSLSNSTCTVVETRVTMTPVTMVRSGSRPRLMQQLFHMSFF
jgi:hypothetical protein